MRYPWKDKYGNLIRIGDLVKDTRNGREGYIELNFRGVPCIHVTTVYSPIYGWETLSNKCPVEAYQRRLFNENRSKFYWWRHRYILPNIILLKQNFTRHRRTDIYRRK